MDALLEDWFKELNGKLMRGDWLSADDHHRLEVLRRDRWRERKITEANQELSWGGAWWRAMQTIRPSNHDE